MGPTSDARYLGTSNDQRLSPSPGQRVGAGAWTPRATWQVRLARNGTQSSEDVVFPP